MSDDLVKRLRSAVGFNDLGLCPEAAARTTLAELKGETDE